MNTLGMSYQEIIEQIDNKVNTAIEKLHEEKSVVYSAYEEDNWGNPIDNLDDIPFKGKIQFVDEDEDFRSEIFDSPTWLQIAIVANQMINKTRNFHHRHFEDFDVFCNKDGIAIAKLIMGSY